MKKKARVYYERITQGGQIDHGQGIRASKVQCPLKGKQLRRGAF